MQVKKEIFKEYDIRGIYPSEISNSTAYAVGRQLSKLLKAKKGLKIVVGQDLRKESKPLTKKLIEGLLDAGINVLDIGQVTTPMLYFAVSALSANGSVMTTASHNPKKYDGFKITKSMGVPVGGEELQKFYAIIKGSPLANPPTSKGVYKKIDISQKYFDTLFKNYKVTRPVKVSISDGGGAAKLFIEELAKRLGGAKKSRPDFYASFDYDADRLMIRDENQNPMRGDVAGAIIGDIILKKKNKLVCDPRCSLGVRKYFLNKGVKVLISRVGHFNIKKMMREKGAIMGIEITGHIYFRNLNFSEDPFFAIRKITEVLDKNPGKKISEIFKPFGSWCHSGTIDLKIKDANKAIAKLKTNYRAGAQSTLDGLTVEFPNHWWFNIRPSHTEPVVRLVVEANSEELLKEKIKEIKELINTK